MFKTETWANRESPGTLVQAARLTEDNVEDVAYWCHGDLVEEYSPEHPEEKQNGINVQTLNGQERASLGMYVARYGKSFFVKHNRPFEMAWKPVDKPDVHPESAGEAARSRGFADPFGRSSS